MKQRMEELMKKKNLSASELLMKIHDMLYPEQRRERYEFCEKNKIDPKEAIAVLHGKGPKDITNICMCQSIQV